MSHARALLILQPTITLRGGVSHLAEFWRRYGGMLRWLGVAYLAVAAVGKLSYALPHLMRDVATWSALDLKYRHREVAERGGRLKFLPVLDEYTREVHAIEVGRSFTGKDVVALLKRLFLIHGEPKYIRSDNGSEFVAKAVQDGLAEAGVKALFIAPGSPWQNGFSESFNSRFRDEFLDRELIWDVREGAVLGEQFRVDYNLERPHMSLGYLTPAEFAARLIALACSEPPEGRQRWTVRLLAERAVELDLAPSVSHMSVHRVLKKTNFDLTAGRTGRSRRRRTQPS